jgi:hypothetical protein
MDACHHGLIINLILIPGHVLPYTNTHVETKAMCIVASLFKIIGQVFEAHQLLTYQKV